MEKIKIILRNFLKWFIFLAFIFGIFYFFVNIVNYFDPINHCYISITVDPLNGNKKTITDALRFLKINDMQTYKKVCSSVDSIEERYCDLRNLMSPESTPWHEAAGCYVKGGRAIYLKPNENDNTSMTAKRVELIRKYTQMNIDFWKK